MSLDQLQHDVCRLARARDKAERQWRRLFDIAFTAAQRDESYRALFVAADVARKAADVARARYDDVRWERDSALIAKWESED